MSETLRIGIAGLGTVGAGTLHLLNTLLSLEVVEVNPVLDMKNGTARMAVDLVTSALGKAIL